MKRTHKVLLAEVLALMLIAALVPFPALADDPPTAVGNPSFNCYLIVNQAADIPTKTFTYTIESGTAETIGEKAVEAGITDAINGKPSIGVAEFSSSDTASSAVSNEDSGSITLDEGEKYAKKTVAIDFGDITFPVPGIYRYVIKQAADGNEFSYDTQRAVTTGTRGTRYLDVYVVSGESGADSTAKVSAYVLHETNAVGSASDKSTGFVNLSAITHSLAFGKAVTGNMASIEKYFKFTLSLARLHTGTTYTVELGYAESTPTNNATTIYTGMTNPASITSDSEGSATTEFYLKHGQYITIQGLPAGYTYELSEDNEDYSPSPGIAADKWDHEAFQNHTSNPTGVASDVKTGYTNSRTSSGPPTGVLLTVAPFAGGMLLFGAAFVYMMSKNRRKN